MAHIESGSSTAGRANVDSNYQLSVTTNTDPTKAGAARMFSENDPGDVTGSAYLYSPETSDDYRLRVAVDSVLDQEVFNYTVQHTGKFHYAFTTLTSTVTGGYLTTNSGSITTITTGCRMRTWRHFAMPLQQSPLYVEFVASFSNTFVTNTTVDFGVFVDGASNPFAPTDGVYFRATSAGLEGIANYNGVESTTGALLVAPGGAAWSPTPNKVYQFLISSTNREVKFWIDDVLYGTIGLSSSQIGPCASLEVPLAVRHAIAGGAASAAMQFKLASYSVQAGDVERDKPWGATMSAMGNGLQVQQGATTGGQLTTYALGAAPGAVTLTASTAPATNTLGGLYLLPAAITAGESDYPLFAWLNPASTVAIQGKTFHCTGIIVGDAVVTTALTGGGIGLHWAVGFGSTASSLVTAESASFANGTTKIARKLPLGVVQWFAATAAVGATAQGRQITFPTSLAVNPGEYLHIIMRAIGTSTSAGGIRGSITPLGYFE